MVPQYSESFYFVRTPSLSDTSLSEIRVDGRLRVIGAVSTALACSILQALNSRSAECTNPCVSRSPSPMRTKNYSRGSRNKAVGARYPPLPTETARARIPRQAYLDRGMPTTTTLSSLPDSPWLLRYGWPCLCCSHADDGRDDVEQTVHIRSRSRSNQRLRHVPPDDDAASSLTSSALLCRRRSESGCTQTRIA